MSEPVMHHFDARGLLCPMPVIKTQALIKTLPHGATLTITATDPGVLHDIPAWCRIHGHQLIRSEPLGKEYIVVIGVLHED